MNNISKIFFLLFLLTLISCNISEEECKIDYPEKIKKNFLKVNYDFAKWELYRLNIMMGDSSFKIESEEYPSSETLLLSSVDLVFVDLKITSDTTTFYFRFQDNLAPIKHSYYNNISFWGDGKVYGVNYYDRGGFVLEKKIMSDLVFMSDLEKKFDTLNCWLKTKFIQKRDKN